MAEFTYTLDLPPGIASDDTTYSSKGRWADGNNVRFWEGKPQVIGGFALNGLSLGVGLRDMAAFYRSGSATMAYGTATKLYVGTALAAPSDRTPAGFVTAGGWCFDAFGSTFLAAPYAGTLYAQSGATAAAAVAAAPARITAMLVTPERQVLALGCNEEISGTFNPSCIRGSDLEDYTVWATSATNNAFEHILDGGGIIVGAKMVGNYVAVWTTDALWMGQFIGDPSQTYRFDKVSDIGLLAQRAVAVAGGEAFWLAPDLRMHRWMPGSPATGIACPILQDFRDNLDISLRQNVAFGTCKKFEEIWILYADARDSGSNVSDWNTRYLAVSLVDGAWFRGRLNRFGILDTGVSEQMASGNAGVVLMSDTAGNIMVHETTSPSVAFDWFIRSADQYLDAGQQRFMIRGMVPDFEDQANTSDSVVSMTLYFRDRPQSTAVTKGPYTLTATLNKKDFRGSGKLVSVEFGRTGVSTGYMRLGKPTFDCVTMGER